MNLRLEREYFNAQSLLQSAIEAYSQAVAGRDRELQSSALDRLLVAQVSRDLAERQFINSIMLETRPPARASRVFDPAAAPVTPAPESSPSGR